MVVLSTHTNIKNFYLQTKKSWSDFSDQPHKREQKTNASAAMCRNPHLSSKDRNLNLKSQMCRRSKTLVGHRRSKTPVGHRRSKAVVGRRQDLDVRSSCEGIKVVKNF